MTKATPLNCHNGRMHIAVFLQNLKGGGAERVALTLVNALAQTHDVSLLLVRKQGDYLDDLSPQVKLVDMASGSTMASIPALSRWLRQNRPDVLMSHLTHVNVAAQLAVRLSRTGTPLVAVEHNQIDLNFARIRQRSVRLAYRAVRYVYPGITVVVSVSQGVEDSVKRFCGFAGQNMRVIANPVVTPALRMLLAEPPAHPWLGDGGAPVLLGCGRLVEQKDFPNLIEAFRLARQQRDLRLLILGEGELRSELEAAVANAGLQDCASLPGFDRNPYAAMAAADLFVLSSRWEGLPTVLIEALAAGTNVVAADCPSGPMEVLEGGRYGSLVPTDDPQALADAILSRLSHPIDRETLQKRADEYSLENVQAIYEDLFREVMLARRSKTPV